MSLKTAFYLAAFVGSTIGSCIPLLWGAGFLSYSSVLFGGIGGILGIVIVYKSRQ
jgi:hypothetical protein